jgi:hypothetical protein
MLITKVKISFKNTFKEKLFNKRVWDKFVEVQNFYFFLFYYFVGSILSLAYLHFQDQPHEILYFLIPTRNYLKKKVSVSEEDFSKFWITQLKKKENKNA